MKHLWLLIVGLLSLTVTIKAENPNSLTTKTHGQLYVQPDIEKTLKKVFGNKLPTKLTASQADTLAAELANYECELGFKLRPFKASTYKSTWQDTVWVWGKFDMAAPNGFSAKVILRVDGRDPRVNTFLSTDLRTMLFEEQMKEGTIKRK